RLDEGQLVRRDRELRVAERRQGARDVGGELGDRVVEDLAVGGPRPAVVDVMLLAGVTTVVCHGSIVPRRSRPGGDESGAWHANAGGRRVGTAHRPAAALIESRHEHEYREGFIRSGDDQEGPGTDTVPA